MKPQQEVRYAFIGSGHFAACCLEILSDWRAPLWVATAPPRPAGRGLRLMETPVAGIASSRGLQLLHSAKVSTDETILSLVQEQKPDFILVVDFAQMIKPPLIDLPPLGCLNIHPSLLPAYRGSAPIQRALMDGVAETGVTVFRLIDRMDAGAVLIQERLVIDHEDTTGSLIQKASALGSRALISYIESTPLDAWVFSPQDNDRAAYAPKIDKNERQMDWQKSASDLSHIIRALSPDPGAYTLYKGKRLAIKQAEPVSGSGAFGTLIALREGNPIISCGSGALELLVVQPEGKTAQSGAEWLRGARLGLGEKLA